MKLTIKNYDKEFQIKNWEVYSGKIDNGSGTYQFLLRPVNSRLDSGTDHCAVLIDRNPTPLNTKMHKTHTVKIAYKEFTKIIHNEDVGIGSFTDKNEFWNSVEQIIEQYKVKNGI